MLRNLALLAVSIGITLLGMELVLRLFYDVPPTWHEPQIRHLPSPLLGWVLPPGAQAWTIDAPVSVNSLGLRDDEIPLRKPAGTKRVLALGDSFTFALGVRFEDLWSERLERRLAAAAPDERFQVINAAVAGYNTRQELIQYLTLGAALEPDLVVLGFYWNDLVGNDEPLPDLQETERIEAGAELAALTQPRHVIPTPIRNALRESVLLYLVVTGAKGVAARLDPPQDAPSVVQRALLSGDEETLAPYWEATAARLRELAEAARQRGTPVILLVFPGENEVRHDFPDLVFGEKLAEIWRPTGFPIIDLTEPYRAALRRGENPFLPYDLHPNALGMEIAAQAVFDVIAEKGWLGVGAGEARPPARAARAAGATP